MSDGFALLGMQGWGVHDKGVCRHGWQQSNGHGWRKVSLGVKTPILRENHYDVARAG